MNYFFAIFFIFYIKIFDTHSEKICSIKYPSTGVKRPTFLNYFGSATLEIPYSDSDRIDLIEGEKITGHCTTGFQPLIKNDRYRYRSEPEIQQRFLYDSFTVEFRCTDGKISIFTINGQRYLDLDYVECKDFKWDVVEVFHSFDMCSSNASSYLLVANMESSTINMAAVCFNLKNMFIESIRYTISGNSKPFRNTINGNIPHPLELESLITGVKIENIVGLAEKYTAKHPFYSYGLLQEAMYERDFIIQNEVYGDFLQGLGDFSKVFWWINLLHGNWKRFTAALNRQSKFTTYDAFTGISGGIKEPQFKTCLNNSLYESKDPTFFQHNELLPAYIWTYLKGRHSSEEFVVIGYNSPFYQFFDPKEIVFCKDICGDIPWLQNVSVTFSYSALGVVFCCTPEDVRNSGIINGFPSEFNTSPPPTTTTTTTTTTAKIFAENDVDEYSTTTETLYDEIGNY